MRIESSSIENVTNGASYVGDVGSNSRSANGSGASGRSDTVSLSNATNLVALAKSSSAAVGQAKLESIGAQLRSGQYQSDTAQLSRSVVQSHIQG
jgi:anti-sigma28 factor (negative regulator of flagellin synthesis)